MPSPIRVVVLDAWPLIESYTQGREPAASMLDELLESGTRPTISAVNFTEVCYGLARHDGPTAAAREIDFLRDFLDIEPLDDATTEAAGWIKHTYRISLGDSFAAATALKHGADLWTGDPELLCSDRIWSVLDLRAHQDRTPARPHRRPSAALLSDHQDVTPRQPPPRGDLGPATSIRRSLAGSWSR